VWYIKFKKKTFWGPLTTCQSVPKREKLSGRNGGQPKNGSREHKFFGEKMGLGKDQGKSDGGRVEINSLRLFYREMTKGDTEEPGITKKPGGIKAANVRPISSV